MMSKSPNGPAPPDPQIELCGQSPVTHLMFDGPKTSEIHPVLFSGHQNGKIIEWNLATQRATTSWPAHTDSVLWMAWLEDKLLSQGRDGAVRIWNRGTAEWIKLGDIQCASLMYCNSAISFCEGLHCLAVPSDQTSEIDVHLINESVVTSSSLSLPSSTSSSCNTSLSSKKHSLRPAAAKNYGMCMRMCACSKDSSSYLFVAYESGIIVLWDLLKGQQLSEMKGHEESIMCINCWTSPDSKSVKCVSGSVDDIVKSWQVEDNKLIEHSSVKITNPGLNDIAIRSDGRIFATGGWDFMGRVFSLSKLRPLAVLTYHRASVQSVAFAPDKTLATGSKDGYIALWDVYKDK